MHAYNASEIFSQEELLRFPVLSKRNHFTIQLHNARRLHYDLRVHCSAVNGTYSWAIPRGLVDLKKGERRLAVQTSIHEQAYSVFEGVLGPGYGAGGVLLWDVGLWTITPKEVETTDEEEGEAEEEEALRYESILRADLAKGHLNLVLHGRKLETCVLSLILPRGASTDWLVLAKSDVQTRGAVGRSVKSGKTLLEVEGQRVLDSFVVATKGKRKRPPSPSPSPD